MLTHTLHFAASLCRWQPLKTPTALIDSGPRMPKPSQAFPSSRVIAPCPKCHYRIYLDGVEHEVFLEPTAGLVSTRPLICPHCSAILVLHHTALHLAPPGTKAFTPPGPHSPRRAHTSSTTRSRSARISGSPPPTTPAAYTPVTPTHTE